MNSALQLFTVPATQTSEQQGRWHDAHPVSGTESGIREFSIDGNAEYIDLAESFIYVKAEITAADGGVLTDKKVAPVNLFLHSLFSQLDVSLNNKLVSSGSDTYPYRAILGTLLNYGSEAKTTRLTSALFYKDTPGAMEQTYPTKAVGAGGNAGLISRYEHSSKSASVEMIGPIHSNIFFQGRYILDFVNLKLKFTRTKSEFCLMSADTNPNHKVIIEDAIVFVRKVKVNSSVSLAINGILRQDTAKYPIRTTEIKTFSVGAGGRNTSHDNVFTGKIPNRIIIALLSNDATMVLTQRTHSPSTIMMHASSMSTLTETKSHRNHWRFVRC